MKIPAKQFMTSSVKPNMTTSVKQSMRWVIFKNAIHNTVSTYASLPTLSAGIIFLSFRNNVRPSMRPSMTLNATLSIGQSMKLSMRKSVKANMLTR